MIEPARRILSYTENCSYEGFSSNRMAVDAVVRNFGILGEAARHVPSDVEAGQPLVPWHKMRGMRNLVVHAYHAVELPTVWKTAREDLPVLLPVLEAMLAEIDRQEPGDRAS
jgi:uncharacterized protein with HEPN domain